MKKKLSYRDKLLELAYIYNVKEIQDYVKRKRPDAYNYDLKTWSMNGCLINNWKKTQINDSRWAENYDIFRSLCKHKKIPNCEFFIIPLPKSTLSSCSFVMPSWLNIVSLKDFLNSNLNF